MVLPNPREIRSGESFLRSLFPKRGLGHFPFPYIGIVWPYSKEIIGTSVPSPFAM